MPKLKKVVCVCDGEFEIPWWSSQKHCSKLCYYMSMVGKKQPEELNEKRSKSLRGRKKPEGFGEKIQKANIGKKHSEEHIENWKKARREGDNWFQSEEAKKKNSKSHGSEKCSKRMLLKWQDSVYREKMVATHRGKCGLSASNWQGGKVKVICQLCGKEFLVNLHRRGIAKYCSIGCKNKGRVGKTNREKNSNWKGGIANLPYPLEFDRNLKKFIRTRDNNTCQLCSKTKEENGKNLCVHHINHDKDDLFELNLISLCGGCNGKVNSNRGLWEDYFAFKLLYGVES
jgi:hypothetical protein